ncbi:YciI family protein [Marinobacter bohaiensis]|uniref:YciI family protein n=1 Tax=Marinobacter bohaiensis TaxID=2201898 RepID=UPI000DAC7428|nr:YciI family protein [Marinobacter bohaiensis]
MRFMIIRRADADTEAGVMPSDAMLQAMGRYNQSLMDAGAFLDGTGLRPSRDGARIDFQDGEPVVTQGPFAETRELIAGFTMIEADSMAHALALVKQWPPEDADGHTHLELRQLYELDDFVEGEGVGIHKDLEQRLQKQPVSIGTHLLFRGDCAEAFAFYADVLGGRVEAAIPFGESPMAEEVEPAWRDRILHAHLSLGKGYLMGCDAPPNHYQTPQGMSVQVEVDTAAKAEQAFARLAEGGTVTMPMEATFWAERFGSVIDRFGIAWMINFPGSAGADCPMGKRENEA